MLKNRNNGSWYKKKPFHFVENAYFGIEKIGKLGYPTLGNIEEIQNNIVTEIYFEPSSIFLIWIFEFFGSLRHFHFEISSARLICTWEKIKW